VPFTEVRRAFALAAALALTGCSSTARGPRDEAAERAWDEYRLKAAGRLVAANPERTYMGDVPEPLLAIPVLEIELNRDGSVNRIKVLRTPTQAKDTVQLAIDAVKRAAPFGDVSKLPKPWKFTEVFLFDDDRRFKPRSLDD
jgi:protein TonB